MSEDSQVVSCEKFVELAQFFNSKLACALSVRSDTEIARTILGPLSQAVLDTAWRSYCATPSMDPAAALADAYKAFVFRYKRDSLRTVRVPVKRYKQTYFMRRKIVAPHDVLLSMKLANVNYHDTDAYLGAVPTAPSLS